mgnify:CR=1 FL=1
MTILQIARLATATSIAIFWISCCEASETSLQHDIVQTLEEEGLTGIAWSLIEGYEGVHHGVAGLKDNQLKLEFTTNTRFHVGSLTKALLATGVLRLATEGSLELDAPVTRYLPGLTFENPWSETSKVTVRHLLDHSSGLSDAQMWQIFSLRPTPDTPLASAFPEPSRQLRIRSKPGTRFSYSNMGYTLLGMMIESVSGSRYETYLDQHLLDPLGMHDSTFTFTSQEGGHADLTLAWGHVDDGSRYAASPMFLRPAGQFTSTTGDLAVFAKFLMGKGVVNNALFIDEKLMRLRGRPSTTLARKAGLEAGYALGLGRRDRHGVVGYCHGGNIVGFVAMLCVFPDQHKAFAYSINTDSETANYGRFDRLFIDALDIENVVSHPEAGPAMDISQWHGWYVLRPNRFASFKYLDEVFGAVKVSARDNDLSWNPMQKQPRGLRPVSGRIFQAHDRSTPSHVFFRGEQGEYLAGDGFNVFEKTSLVRLILHWLSVLLGLAGLAWLLLYGMVSLAIHRSGFLGQPTAPAFIAIALLPVPIPFFFSQSFMALGDFTLASALLAVVTLLLPAGMLFTVLRGWKFLGESYSVSLSGWAALLVLQWCFVLMVEGMLPLRLWVL